MAIRPGASDQDAEYDNFLVTEGLDLLAAFRAIKSSEARRAILTMVAAVAQAEADAAEKEQAAA